MYLNVYYLPRKSICFLDIFWQKVKIEDTFLLKMLAFIRTTKTQNCFVWKLQTKTTTKIKCLFDNSPIAFFDESFLSSF